MKLTRVRKLFYQSRLSMSSNFETIIKILKQKRKPLMGLVKAPSMAGVCGENGQKRWSICSIERTEIGAGAEVGSFPVGSAKGVPGAGAEEFVIVEVVHVNGNAEHGGEGDEF